MIRLCRRVRPSTSAVLLGTWLGACALAQAQVQTQAVTLHYQERAPYSSTQADGKVVGLTAAPAAQALQRAGLKVTWARTPGQRQLALIQEGTGLHCGLGWFRNAERSAQGKFSKPLYRDRPFGALVRNDSSLRSGVRGEEALAASAEVLLVKEGYSYGSRFDRLIAQRTPAPVSTSVETSQMVRMLMAGRASWMLVGAEEAEVLRQQPHAAATLRSVSLVDMPAGETRHLYCNRAVPDDWLARFDQALPAGAN